MGLGEAVPATDAVCFFLEVEGACSGAPVGRSDAVGKKKKTCVTETPRGLGMRFVKWE